MDAVQEDKPETLLGRILRAIVVAIVAMVAAFGVAVIMRPASTPPPETVWIDFKTSIELFANNPARWNARYLDKATTVAGTLIEITADGVGAVVMTKDGGIVACHDAQPNDLIALNRQDSVLISGVIRGYESVAIALRDCRLR